MSMDSVLNAIYNHQEYNTFFAKGEVSYSDAEFDGTADAQLRILKDSMACLIIKKIGIELFRILVDKDSVIILDRIEKTWQKKSIQDWTSQLKLPIDYYLIQDVISTGFYLSEYLSYEWHQKSDSSVLNGSSELFQFNTYMNLNPLRSLKILFNSLGQESTIQIAKHYTKNGKIIPQNIMIQFKNTFNEKKFIHLNWKEINLNSEETIKFDIPSHYTRR